MILHLVLRRLLQQASVDRPCRLYVLFTGSLLEWICCSNVNA